jgi:predicted dehydrogenase
MTLRVGILGTGHISESHARAADEAEGVEVTAVYGRSREKAAQLAAPYGAAAYDDLAAFVRDARVDAVLVGTPPGWHREHGLAAIGAGKHVLMEKPLDTTPARCDVIIEAADAAGVRLGVFFQGRTSPEVAWMKRLVDRGELGRPFLAAAQVRWLRPPDYYGGERGRGSWERDGGGALMSQAIHTLDLLLWMMGDAEKVYGHAINAMHDIEVEDTVVATLELASGGVATLEATTAAYPGYPRRLELTGTEGTVVLENERVTRCDLRSPPSEPIPREAADETPSASSPKVSDVRGHRRMIEDFATGIRTGGPLLCDGREGRRSIAVVDAVYRSARAGEPVRLTGIRSSARFSGGPRGY